MHWRPWMAPGLGAAAAVFCYAPFLYIEVPFAFPIIYLFPLSLLVLLVSLALLAVMIYRRRANWYILLTPALFFILSLALCQWTDHLRPRAQWLVFSHSYKRELPNLASSPKTGLQYREWDGWGMAGSDTFVFLIHDPTDELGDALRRHLPGRFAALEQHTWFYERLESGWYSVTFYTNDPWDPNENI